MKNLFCSVNLKLYGTILQMVKKANKMARLFRKFRVLGFTEQKGKVIWVSGVKRRGIGLTNLAKCNRCRMTRRSHFNIVPGGKESWKKPEKPFCSVNLNKRSGKV